MRIEDEDDEDEDDELSSKYDAKKQFNKKIIRPPALNKKVDGNKMKGFTVWCSSGYSNDGWHSYGGPPDQEFDSTWKTAADANDRARYLFIWKNTYGSAPTSLIPTTSQRRMG
jgi:hypothetical protein